MTNGQPLSADEFLGVPLPEDGTTWELKRGTLVSVPPTSHLPDECSAHIARCLASTEPVQRLGLVARVREQLLVEQAPDTIRYPDLAYWQPERLTRLVNGFPEYGPDVIVEVLSPADSFGAFTQKLDQYLRAGVKLMWCVDPGDRLVIVQRLNRTFSVLRDRDTLNGEMVVPGLSNPVADLFPS